MQNNMHTPTKNISNTCFAKAFMPEKKRDLDSLIDETGGYEVTGKSKGNTNDTVETAATTAGMLRKWKQRRHRKGLKSVPQVSRCQNDTVKTSATTA